MERRLLLTTLTAGTFQFVDAANKPYIVALTGNITAELFASDGASLIDLVTAADIAVTPPAVPPVVGRDVFAIYITSSDINATLAITAAPPPPPGGTGTGGDVFTGGVGSFFGGQALVTAPAGAGQIYIGRYVKGTGTAGNIPEITVSDGSLISVAAQALAASSGGFSGGQYLSGIYSANSVGKILIDGTVTGLVHINGSIGTFYSGWLLTGDASASGGFLPDNFFVAGDMANLLVRTSVGTQSSTLPANGLNYDTGVQVHVAGKIGTVEQGGMFAGSITADNAPIAPSLAALGFGWREPTTWLIGNANTAANRVATFAGGLLPIQNAGDPFANGTFAAPFYVGSLNLAANPKGISLAGTLQGVAGAALGPDPVDYYAFGVLAGQTVNIVLWTSTGQLGIFDPDGRLISTTMVLSGTTRASFTADRAGAYRVAIGLPGDRDVNGAAGNVPIPGTLTYGLAIAGVANTAIGGVAVGGDFLTENTGVTATVGSIGTIYTGGNFLGGGAAPADISAPRGSLLDLEAASVGIINGAKLKAVPTISVSGKVGLISGTSGVVALVRAGDDIQTLSSGGDLEGQYVTNKSIGIVRAASILGNESFVDMFSADADKSGRDGFLELLDVTGDLGSILFGGPRITTGPGGDVRFVHVGGAIYQDPAFGGGATSNNGGIIWSVGEAVTFTDDSGAKFTITPTATGQLTTYTYGIYGSGGVAITKITSTSSLSIQTSSTSSSALQRADIGEINMTGSGAALATIPFVFNGNTINLPVNDPAALPAALNNLGISGPIATDVFLVSASGIINNIANSTGGDILNINSTGDIGSIGVVGNLGSTVSRTAVLLNQTAVVANTYPFVQQHIGIVAKSIGNISAKQVGNIIASGSITSLNAGTGGITGPVEVTGNLGSVNIGGGLAESGQVGVSSDVSYGAAMSRAGLYVGGVLVGVRGNNADIRGDIISNTGIGAIGLSGGSIIGSQIGVYSTFQMADYLFVTTRILPKQGGLLSAPIFEIQNIILTGNGGIIGTLFEAADIGTVTVAPTGFGILGADFGTPGDGVLNSMTAGGYGIRGVFFSGAKINSLNATGNGSLASPAQYSPRVRVSTRAAFDPATGQAPTSETDLDLFMKETFLGDKDYRTGLIANSQFVGSQSLGSVNAFTITQFPGLGVPIFNFANSVGNIRLASGTSDFKLVTGSLGSFFANGNVSNLDLHVAGAMGPVSIAGSFISGTISAKGPSASLQSLFVGGNFSGTLLSEGPVGSVTIGYAPGQGNFAGNIQLLGGSPGMLTFNAAFRGALQINGHAPNINMLQGMAATSYLTIVGDASNINLGGALNGHVLVTGNLGQITGGGKLAGTVAVWGALGRMVWNGPMSGTLSANAGIGSATLGGTMTFSGAITSSGGNIGSLTVGGTLGGTVGAQGIGTLTTGALSWNTHITAGNLTNLTVRGNAAGGAIHVTGALSKMTVGASLTGTQMTLGGLGWFTVGGSFGAGSALRASGTVANVGIGGNLSGDILVDGTLGALTAGNASGATVTAGTGIGSLTIWGAMTKSLVQAGITAGADHVFGTSDANELVLPAAIGPIRVGSMTNSVIAAGGSINGFRSPGGLVDSSVSSALVMAGARVQEVINGTNPLSSVGSVQALRAAPTLLASGHIGSAIVAKGAAGGLDANSFLTAGISPGADGIFGDVDDASNGVSTFLVKVAAAQLPHVLSAR